MKESNFISILSKELTGELSTEEMSQLEALKANYSFNEERNEIRQSWDTAHSYGSDIDVDVNAAFKKFGEKYNIPVVGLMGDDSSGRYLSLILKITVALIILLVGVFVVRNLSSDSPTFKNNSNEFKKVQISEYVSVNLAPDSKLQYEAGHLDIHKGRAQINISKESKDIFEFKGGTLKNANTDSDLIFELNQYDDSKSILKIIEGDMILSIEDKIIDLSPSDVIDYNLNDGRFGIQKIATTVSSFNDKVLNFNNTPLQDVFSEMESFFGIDIEINSELPKSCHFTAGNLVDPSINDVFALMHTSFNMGVNRIALDKYEVYNISCK